ncbi:hypothetical protein I4U23_020998 [Adineta vaga]|nr:hypothetical protein I4U23_020998 [Adineta vaga]
MHNDLMLFSSLFFFFVIITFTFGQQSTLYVKHGEIAELCDNRSTSIYAYEYRSFDGKKNLIVEPTKDDRYSNPYRTSLLRIKNVNEDDSGLYKCPQDDTEWQRLQIYSPIQHVYLSNLHVTSRTRTNDLCGMDNNNCLVMIEGESLDIVCAADGSPRPAFDIAFDKSGPPPTIMALAGSIQLPSVIKNQFKPTVYEAYRIAGLTPQDNGRNLTCRVDMKQVNEKLILSSTKQVYIEFRPTVLEKSRKIYLGVNQTRTINCTVIRANPTYIRYTINGLPSSIIHRTYSEPNQMYFTFDITPTSTEQFHAFNVTANNSIGYDTCNYELIHGGVPDAITQCTVDTHTSNATTTISCAKSYDQGDSDGYTCVLFKYNGRDHEKMFEEDARTKSCIFALIPLREPVEYRIAAFNRYGSLPINTFGYVIHLNQPIMRTEKPFFNKKILVVIGSIFGGALLFFFLCCLCGTCHRDRTKLSNRNNFYQKDTFPLAMEKSQIVSVHQIQSSPLSLPTISSAISALVDRERIIETDN